MIYFTSDTHFDHQNAMGFSSRAHMSFCDVNEMNEFIVRQWNSIVNTNDMVYHLGDVCWKGVDIMSRLNGKITLIKGNHDHHKSIKKMLSAGYIKEVRDEFRGLIGEKYFHMYHYPLASWDRQAHGSIHLHGHTHSAEFHSPLDGSYCVCGDIHNFIPVSLDQIVEKCK